MADLTYEEARQANELVNGTPGVNQEQIDGTEVVGATSSTSVDSGWTFATIRDWASTHPDLMLKSEYDTGPTNGIVDAAGSVENNVGGSKTADEIITHIDQNNIHTPLNDAQTTTTNLWSASKINAELVTKADDADLTSHESQVNPHGTGHTDLTSGIGTNTHAQIDTHIADTTGNPHSVTHAQLPDKGLNTHAQIDTHIADTLNPHSVTHALLPDNGTNTHAQIDSHIADTNNPHSVTAAQANAAPSSHVGDSSHLDTDERNAMSLSNNPSASNAFATVNDLIVVEDEGISLTRRGIINFIGAGVTATDNGVDATDVTIPGGAGTSGHVIQDEGVPLTQRANLNFAGAGVTVTDDSGNDASLVTITTGGGGEANVGANVGAGTGLSYRDKTAETLNFRSLIGGADISVTNNADDITIAYTGSGGGIPDAPDDSFGYLREGSASNTWVRGSRVTEAATAPSTPGIGDVWIDTT